MEVRCSNCATEYEFDDALVSARGTSVKCTNCGHQFRVHPTTASPTVAEKWVVRDALKRETTFTSLRDLQQAIVKGQLSPTHHLSHGGQAFRPLEDIYELQTFFSASRQRPPSRPAPRTLLGVGRDGQPPPRPPSTPPRPPSTPPPPRKRNSDAPQERVTPVAGMAAINAATALEALGPGSPRASFEAAGRQGKRPSTPLPPAYNPQAFISQPYGAQPYNAAPERAYISTQTTSPPSNVAPLPWQNLQGLHAQSEVDDDLAPRRSAGSRWIIAIVVLGALGLVAGTVGRDYLLGFAAPKAVAPPVDERVPALIEQARLALAKGDFESANAELAKASVLGENDPRVAAELARLEVARVEPLWTQQRLVAALETARAGAPAKAPPRRKKTDAEIAAEALAVTHAANEKTVIEQTFRERLGKARLAVADAVRRAPASVDVVRSQVDLLRLDGNLAQARTMVNALSARATDPDNAYSLGALDLAEGPAGYPSAIERLRVAARSEEALGRARPLLIYALSTTDPAAASAELDKLQAVAPLHRSLPVLRALVEIEKAKLAPPEPPPPVRKPPAPAAATSTPASATSATPAPPRAASPSGEGASKGPLAKAAEAHQQGDLDAAEGLYRAVLQRTPNSIPALSGLGDIARQRHANATAAAYYDQILKQDRNHVPTLMARGDMYWEGGNRILAVALYRRALGQVGSSNPTGQRALRRIEEFDRDVAAIDSRSTEPPASPGPAPSGAAPSGVESPASPGAAPSGSDPAEPPAPEPSPAPEPPSGDEPSPSESSRATPPAPSAPKASAPSRPAEPGAGKADEPAGAPSEQP